jgi:hypothetical protein
MINGSPEQIAYNKQNAWDANVNTEIHFKSEIFQKTFVPFFNSFVQIL